MHASASSTKPQLRSAVSEKHVQSGIKARNFHSIATKGLPSIATYEREALTRSKPLVL